MNFYCLSDIHDLIFIFIFAQRIQCNKKALSESTTIDLNNINTSDAAISVETFVIKYKNVLCYVAVSGKLMNGYFP